MEKGVSVIVCCYNSEHRIKETLKHLFHQKVTDNLQWEIILVNNNSTDNTVEVASSEYGKQKNNVSFSIVNEPTPGLSHARERGIKESSFEYLLFCDDDNHLVIDYLDIGFKKLERHRDVAMLGGIGYPVLDKEEPEWFKKCHKMYAVGEQEEGNFDLSKTKSYTYGAGTFIRKQAYFDLKEKRVDFLLTDRIGKKLVSGGDNELGYLFVAAGYRILWDKKLKFKHFIPTNRLNLGYIKRMRYGYAFTYEAIMSYQSWLKNGKNIRTKKIIFREFVNSLNITLRLFLKKTAKQNNNFNFVFKYYFHQGRVIDIIQNSYRYPQIHRKVEKNMMALNSKSR